MSVPVKQPAPSSDLDPVRIVGRLIKQVSASMMRGIDQRMQPLGLTAMQWEPLLLIYKERANTVVALARESQVDCGAMTRMLDRLEEKGLLRRQRSDADRRVVHLQLTEKGHNVAQDILPLVTEELRHQLRDFAPAETSNLIHLLQRMVDNGNVATRDDDSRRSSV
jgi:DNA-binding MarR family transcriptional regulator